MILASKRGDILPASTRIVTRTLFRVSTFKKKLLRYATVNLGESTEQHKQALDEACKYKTFDSHLTGEHFAEIGDDSI